MRVRSWRSLACLILFLGLIAGCGSGTTRRPLSGSVTYKGAPLDRGVITFFATEGRPGPKGGAPIENGRFTMPLTQGLDPGKYRVEISSSVPGGTLTPEEQAAGASPRAKEVLASKYNTESTITIEVKAGGTNEFQFATE